MTRSVVRVGVLGCVLFVGGAPPGWADANQQAAPKESATSKAALPPAVEAAFRKAYPRASIKDVSREGADYEIESVDAGQARDLVYRADGTLVSYEEAITERGVPAAVLSAVKARFPDFTATTFEKVVTGTRISYELAGKRHGKALEVELSEAGEWLNPKPGK